MEPDRSLQITWPLAAQEAILGEFSYIEPFHLFLAALKFAEVEDEKMQSVAGDSGTAKELLAERNSLQALLRTHSITVPEASRPIRRGLRRQLGRGGHPHDGRQPIHRSEATREVFKKAEGIARTSNASQLTTSHLLQALFESPPKEVRTILASAGIRLIRTYPDTPAINKYGRLLGVATAGSRSAGQTEQTENFMKDAVGKVVLEVLGNQSRKGVLLIQKAKRTPGQVAENLALYLRQASVQPPVPLERIYEIDFASPPWQAMADKPRDMENTIRSIFDEAVRSTDLALFFKDLPGLFTWPGGKNCPALIRERIAKGIHCIAGTDETGYRKYFEKDSGWKKVFQAVWIHDLDLPFRL